jgi:hypothetical protein
VRHEAPCDRSGVQVSRVKNLAQESWAEGWERSDVVEHVPVARCGWRRSRPTNCRLSGVLALALAPIATIRDLRHLATG